MISSYIVGSKSWYSIGRQPTNDLALSNNKSSRLHALIAHDEEGNIKVMDLGSTHGTFLDGKRLEKNKPHKMVPGSTLTFGDPAPYYVLEVGSQSEAPAPAAAAVKKGEKRKAEEPVEKEEVVRDAAYYEKKKQWKKEAKKRKWQQKTTDKKKQQGGYSKEDRLADENARVAASIG